ncbi:MAG: HAMP domain-containing histidine kinase [Christensenellaceae bacterium]|nr:HAMP domain-containing histidine kinase [Christensenellaceae bacterium]
MTISEKLAERKPLKGNFTAKAAAFIALIFLVALVLTSFCGILLMVNQGIYEKTETEAKREAFYNLASDDAFKVLLYTVGDNNEMAAVRMLQESNIIGLWIMHESSSDSESMIWQYGAVSEQDAYYETYWRNVEEGYFSYYPEEGVTTEKYEVQLNLANEMLIEDEYYRADKLVSFLYSLRYSAIIICVFGVLLGVILFIFLLVASGHKNGREEIAAGWATNLPFDFVTAVFAGVFFFLLVFFDREIRYANDFQVVLSIVLLGMLFAVCFVGWCMSLALRIKLKTLIKNNLLYRFFSLLWRICRSVARFIRHLVCSIPLVWKSLLGAILLFGCEFAGILVTINNNDEAMIILWFISRLLILTCVAILALMLKKLADGGKALANGETQHIVDTKWMLPDMRAHGENLNRLGEGIGKAVEQRMKSERMKTELITNVSHDLKTPLTSIINYADLIEKENSENENIREYAAVLHRQSERLKRLIEDLVEASKASTGNLEIDLAPVELNILTHQAAGEYEQRLADAGLYLVLKVPEESIRIMADSRRLWRVFDNLLSNTVKYALSGTRFYLTLEENEGFAKVSFKNISREQLGIRTDELLERFVRGDAARNSEGNGLGLSIAKSLVELMGGEFLLHVDADLFTVELIFPMIKE